MVPSKSPHVHRLAPHLAMAAEDERAEVVGDAGTRLVEVDLWSIGWPVGLLVRWVMGVKMGHGRRRVR